MHTEDDERTYDEEEDFYKNIDEESDTQDENTDFYNEKDESHRKSSKKSKTSNEKAKTKNKIKIIAVLLLLILFGVLVYFLIKALNNKDNKPEPDINLLTDSITIKVGDSSYISYEIINTDEKIETSFKSDDTSIATVDANGNVTGINEGNTVVTVSYRINRKTKEKKCNVIVEKDDSGSNPPTPEVPSPTLSLSLVNIKEGVWTKDNVTINVNASVKSGTVSSKYTINCNKDCSYTTITNNKITISREGASVVSVVATANGKSVTKTITVNIDKTKPTVTLQATPSSYISNSSVRVCAKCSDGGSGCKENEVCKTYTSSASNQTLTVTDKAGNSTVSGKFNVTINKIKPTCTLSVSSTGLVTATPKDATKYSFDSSLNTNQTTLQLNETTPGTKRVTYYVKNSVGESGTCFIDVRYSCVCLFTGYDGKCYKNIAGSINKTEAQCRALGGNHVYAEGKCYVLSNQGYTCTYS